MSVMPQVEEIRGRNLIPHGRENPKDTVTISIFIILKIFCRTEQISPCHKMGFHHQCRYNLFPCYLSNTITFRTYFFDLLGSITTMNISREDLHAIPYRSKIRVTE